MMYNNELYHHGVKGMKWGIRRFQNEDGTRTAAGKKRYNDYDAKKAAYKTAKKEYSKSFDKAYNKAIAAYSPIKKHREANDARWEDAYNKAKAMNKAKAEYKSSKKDFKEYKNKQKNSSKTIETGKQFAKDTLSTAIGSYATSMFFGKGYGALNFAVGTANNAAKATGNEKIIRNVNKGSKFVKDAGNSWMVGTFLTALTGNPLLGTSVWIGGTVNAAKQLRKNDK